MDGPVSWKEDEEYTVVGARQGVTVDVVVDEGTRDRTTVSTNGRIQKGYLEERKGRKGRKDLGNFLYAPRMKVEEWTIGNKNIFLLLVRCFRHSNGNRLIPSL